MGSAGRCPRAPLWCWSCRGDAGFGVRGPEGMEVASDVSPNGHATGGPAGGPRGCIMPVTGLSLASLAVTSWRGLSTLPTRRGGQLPPPAPGTPGGARRAAP